MRSNKSSSTARNRRREIVWTRQSRNDLRNIRSYIAAEAPRTADLFVGRLVASVRRIGTAPHAGSIVMEWNDPTLREIYFGNYRIIYRISKRVEIITVFHGARLLGDLE